MSAAESIIHYYNRLNGNSISLPKLKELRDRVEKHIDSQGHGPFIPDLQGILTRVTKAIKKLKSNDAEGAERVELIPIDVTKHTGKILRVASGWKEGSPASEGVESNVKEIPIGSIFTDTKRFQNRTDAFSEASANNVALHFDANKFDPIVVWKDTANGKTYVLSGHSRLEGMKRRHSKTIPVRYFSGNEEEAIKFARVEANRSANAENLIEDLAAYKLMRDGKEGVKPATKTELQRIFKGKVGKLEAYSHLNTGGLFIQALSQSNTSNYPYLERNAQWVGIIRNQYPVISHPGEDNIFHFFYSDKSGRNIKSSKDDFFALVKKRVNGLRSGESVLFPECSADGCKATVDREADPQKGEAFKRLREINEALDSINEKLTSKDASKRVTTDEEKKYLRATAETLQQEKDRINRDLDIIDKSQASLFGIDLGKIAEEEPLRTQQLRAMFARLANGGENLPKDKKPVSQEKELTPQELKKRDDEYYNKIAQEQENEKRGSHSIKGHYIINGDRKAELHLDYEGYKSLPQSVKDSIKSAFIWGRGRSAWISRGGYPNWSAEQVIKSLNLPFEGKEDRYTFEEKMERKESNADYRKDKLLERARKAESKSELLQSDFNRLRKDWAWLTQPVVRGSSFERQKNRVMDRYEKGMQEYRNSEYLRAKARTTGSALKQLSNPNFLQRRIKDAETSIKKIEKWTSEYVKVLEKGTASKDQLDKIQNSWLPDGLERLQEAYEKKAFYSARLNELMEEEGVKVFNKETLKDAEYIKTDRGRWYKVIRVNPSSVTHSWFAGDFKHPFTDIVDAVFKGDKYNVTPGRVNGQFEIELINKIEGLSGHHSAEYQVKYLGKKYFVIYKFSDGEEMIMSKPYATERAANKRKKSIEKQAGLRGPQYDAFNIQPKKKHRGPLNPLQMAQLKDSIASGRTPKVNLKAKMNAKEKPAPLFDEPANDPKQTSLFGAKNKKHQKNGFNRSAHSNDRTPANGKVSTKKAYASASQLAGIDFYQHELGPYKKDFHRINSDSNVMVWGKPGHGKTVLLLKLAQHLAGTGKKVLYISNEEYGKSTLAEKIKAFNIGHNNLFFAGSMDGIDLNDFDVIFFDSINSMGLNSHDVKELDRTYPNKLFVLVVQTTKEGDFRGGKDWEHLVDIAGEVRNRKMILRKNRLDPNYKEKADKILIDELVNEKRQAEEIKQRVKEATEAEAPKQVNT